jgi:hypothetical protein
MIESEGLIHVRTETEERDTRKSPHWLSKAPARRATTRKTRCYPKKREPAHSAEGSKGGMVGREALLRARETRNTKDTKHRASTALHTLHAQHATRHTCKTQSHSTHSTQSMHSTHHTNSTHGTHRMHSTHSTHSSLTTRRTQQAPRYQSVLRAEHAQHRQTAAQATQHTYNHKDTHDTQTHTQDALSNLEEPERQRREVSVCLRVLRGTQRAWGGRGRRRGSGVSLRLQCPECRAHVNTLPTQRNPPQCSAYPGWCRDALLRARDPHTARKRTNDPKTRAAKRDYSRPRSP